MPPLPSAALSPGDTSWQLVAATLTALMTVPGLILLYGGLLPRRAATDAVGMVLYAFGCVLVVWLLWGDRMALGQPLRVAPGLLGALVGSPGPVLGTAAETSRASIPLLSESLPSLRIPGAALAYFQFTFAAITPALIAGAVAGRIRLQAWMLFVPLWVTGVYTVNAFLLWGGGLLTQIGALDWSGGYVVHVAAGVSGLVVARMLGRKQAMPGATGDRTARRPSRIQLHTRSEWDLTRLLMAVTGAGLLWLGWNGFNGGDAYFASADAAAAVLNTNLAAALALMTWMGLDLARTGRVRLTDALGGLVSGLVAITPAAGYVNGYGALAIGVLAGLVPYASLHGLGRLPWFRVLDDRLGVFHTHFVAGALGGLLTGLLADPAMTAQKDHAVSQAAAGLFYGDPARLGVQALALLVITAYDGVMTFGILRLVNVFTPLRQTRAEPQFGATGPRRPGSAAMDPTPWTRRPAASSRAAEARAEVGDG